MVEKEDPEPFRTGVIVEAGWHLELGEEQSTHFPQSHLSIQSESLLQGHYRMAECGSPLPCQLWEKQSMFMFMFAICLSITIMPSEN